MDTHWKSVEDKLDKLEKTQQEMFEWLKKKIGERGILGPVPGVTVQLSSGVGDSMENTSDKVPSLIQPRKEGFLPWFLNPRFDLPILSNQNPRDWLNRCEEYFSEYRIESCKWVELASPNLDGVAKWWFDGWILQNPNVNWKQFVEGLCERFESRDLGGVVKEQMNNDTNVQVGDFVSEVGMFRSPCAEVTSSGIVVLDDDDENHVVKNSFEVGSESNKKLDFEFTTNSKAIQEVCQKHEDLGLKDEIPCLCLALHGLQPGVIGRGISDIVCAIPRKEIHVKFDMVTQEIGYNHLCDIVCALGMQAVEQAWSRKVRGDWVDFYAIELGRISPLDVCRDRYYFDVKSKPPDDLGNVVERSSSSGAGMVKIVDPGNGNSVDFKSARNDNCVSFIGDGVSLVSQFEDGNLLIISNMINYKGFNESNAESFVEKVIVRNQQWSAGATEVLTGSYIFIYAHGIRDKRRGVCGYKKLGGACVEDETIYEKAKNLLRWVENHLCESYAQFLCYVTGNIWVLEEDLWTDVDRQQLLDIVGADKASFLYTKNRTVEAIGKSLVMRTNTCGVVELQGHLLLYESWDPGGFEAMIGNNIEKLHSSVGGVSDDDLSSWFQKHGLQILGKLQEVATLSRAENFVAPYSLLVAVFQQSFAAILHYPILHGLPIARVFPFVIGRLCCLLFVNEEAQIFMMLVMTVLEYFESFLVVAATGFEGPCTLDSVESFVRCILESLEFQQANLVHGRFKYLVFDVSAKLTNVEFPDECAYFVAAGVLFLDVVQTQNRLKGPSETENASWIKDEVNFVAALHAQHLGFLWGSRFVHCQQIQLSCDIARALLRCGSLGVFDQLNVFGTVLVFQKTNLLRPTSFITFLTLEDKCGLKEGSLSRTIHRTTGVRNWKRPVIRRRKKGAGNRVGKLHIKVNTLL